MYNNDLSHKLKPIVATSTVPTNNTSKLINYPDGTSIYTPILGYSVAIDGAVLQHSPSGINLYSKNSNFQITTYNMDTQYEGKVIYIYFGAYN